MIKVRANDCDANNVMSMVRDLREKGLVQGTDFDFAYFQSRYDPVSGHFIEGRHAIFTFYVEKYATWFTLKYSEYI